MSSLFLPSAGQYVVASYVLNDSLLMIYPYDILIADIMHSTCGGYAYFYLF